MTTVELLNQIEIEDEQFALDQLGQYDTRFDVPYFPVEFDYCFECNRATDHRGEH